MEGNKGGKKRSFEDALFNALNAHGLLFPVTDKKVTEYEREAGNTEQNLPAGLENGSKFIPKKGRTIPLIPEFKNIPKKALYAKVAFKKRPKKND